MGSHLDPLVTWCLSSPSARSLKLGGTFLSKFQAPSVVLPLRLVDPLDESVHSTDSGTFFCDDFWPCPCLLNYFDIFYDIFCRVFDGFGWFFGEHVPLALDLIHEAGPQMPHWRACPGSCRCHGNAMENLVENLGQRNTLPRFGGTWTHVLRPCVPLNQQQPGGSWWNAMETKAVLCDFV